LCLFIRRQFIPCVYSSGKTLFFVWLSTVCIAPNEIQARLYSLCLFIRQDIILCVYILGKTVFFVSM